ncbi:MAG: 16S rRNA processing protein RimM [Bacteroidetes bacterium]|nr:16S rRNA processing protein RimM [Bacteroidota bacterium]
MEKSEAYNIGTIVKSKGTNGEMVLLFNVDDPSGYTDLEFVFIEIEERLIPFHIDSIRIKEAYAIVALEDINTPEKAQEMVDKDLYLPLTDRPDSGPGQFYSHEIVGFTVVDKEKGEIGKVKQVLDRPEQSLLQISHGNKEILIPFVDEIILTIDKISHQITIQAPEGLIDLYMD